VGTRSVASFIVQDYKDGFYFELFTQQQIDFI
jgi:hypothetical protein